MSEGVLEQRGTDSGRPYHHNNNHVQGGCHANAVTVVGGGHSGPARTGTSLGGACADACPEPVFEPQRDPPWRLSVAIEEPRCLPHGGVHCEACRDACPEGAIRFTPRLGGPPTPAILAERCTGCGACAGVCPDAAITITPAKEEAAA